MKSDVKLLIEALTTERNSLDRAIDALRAIGAPVEARPKVDRRTPTRHVAKDKRTRIDAHTKQAIVGLMTSAGAKGCNLRQAADLLAPQYGVNPTTVYTMWRTWKAQIDTETLTPGRNVPPAVTHEPEPVTA